MGKLELVIVGGAAPALLMLIYTQIKARAPVASLTLWAGLLCGMGCCFPTLGAEYVGIWLHQQMHLAPTAASAVLYFGILAPIEEAAKLVIILALVQLPGPRPSQRTLVAAMAVGVGFALLENVGFLTSVPSLGGTAIARAATAVPANGLFAMAMGALVVRARIYPARRGLLIAVGYVLATGLHGAYDFIVVTQISRAIEPIQMLELGAVVAIGAFNRGLALAQAADEEAGETWPAPVRALSFSVGALVLVWPGSLMLGALAKPDLLAAYGLLAIFPLLLAADLLRGAFARTRRRHGIRLALPT